MPGIVKIINENEETIACHHYNIAAERKNIIRHWDRKSIVYAAIQIYPHIDVAHVKPTGENYRNYRESGR